MDIEGDSIVGMGGVGFFRYMPRWSPSTKNTYSKGWNDEAGSINNDGKLSHFTKYNHSLYGLPQEVYAEPKYQSKWGRPEFKSIFQKDNHYGMAYQEGQQGKVYLQNLEGVKFETFTTPTKNEQTNETEELSWDHLDPPDFEPPQEIVDEGSDAVKKWWSDYRTDKPDDETSVRDIINNKE